MLIKRPPIGTSDFKEIIEDDYLYADKSLLIKYIMESGKVVLITRPRRFGKTTNQFMLKYFFEKTKESNAHLFKNLKIWKHEKYRKMQWKYPVIFLTFKDEKQFDNKEAINSIKDLIAEEYKRHHYVLEIIQYESDRKIYKSIENREADNIDFQKSLLNLSKYLHEYYGKKAKLIKDEYDNPIITEYSKGYYD